MNVSSAEKIGRGLRAKVEGMALLVCVVWHEECNRC